MVDFDFGARSAYRMAKTKQTHVQGPRTGEGKRQFSTLEYVAYFSFQISDPSSPASEGAAQPADHPSGGTETGELGSLKVNETNNIFKCED